MIDMREEQFLLTVNRFLLELETNIEEMFGMYDLYQAREYIRKRLFEIQNGGSSDV